MKQGISVAARSPTLRNMPPDKYIHLKLMQLWDCVQYVFLNMSANSSSKTQNFKCAETHHFQKLVHIV